jgi:hypothetical protein
MEIPSLLIGPKLDPSAGSLRNVPSSKCNISHGLHAADEGAGLESIWSRISKRCANLLIRFGR